MMRLLLDTHALLWAAFEPWRLSAAAREAIEDGQNEVYVSAVSAYEIATKVRLGKLKSAEALATDFVGQIEAQRLTGLAMTAQHGEVAGGLTIDHDDPWDRLLIAQAQVEELVLVTKDSAMRRFCARTFW